MQATVAPAQSLAGDLAAFMRYVHRTSQPEWFGVVDELQLSLTQLKALHVLDEHGHLAVKALGEALGLSLPAASRAADGLVQRGLADRHECAEDRRSRRIALSSEGRATLARVEEARLAGLARFVETLSAAEREALWVALTPVLERTRR